MKESVSNFCWWFRFNPHDFMESLKATDAEAGKRFKELLFCLLENKATEGTPEFEMIQNAFSYRQKQRERVLKRWQQQQEQEQQPVVRPQQPVVRPPRPRIPPQRVQPPDMRDVYDFCDANNILPTTGREWYEYMQAKGWNNLKSQWQNALKGFASKKE